MKKREDRKGGPIALSRRHLINKGKNKGEKNSRQSQCFFVSSISFYLYFCFFLCGFSLLLFRFSFSARSFACARRATLLLTTTTAYPFFSLYPSASPLVSTAAPSLTGAFADFGPCPSCALPRRKERKRLELTCFMFGENKWREVGDEKYDTVLIIIAGRSQ